jgi:hypothetical protein
VQIVTNRRVNELIGADPGTAPDNTPELVRVEDIDRRAYVEDLSVLVTLARPLSRTGSRSFAVTKRSGKWLITGPFLCVFEIALNPIQHAGRAFDRFVG